MESSQVAIIGSGLIGRSWAMVFAAGGFKVKLYDIAQQQLTSALENIRAILLCCISKMPGVTGILGAAASQAVFPNAQAEAPDLGKPAAVLVESGPVAYNPDEEVEEEEVEEDDDHCMSALQLMGGNDYGCDMDDDDGY